MSLKIIILAGGKGTRISPVIGNTPKILASVAGKPFLEWFLTWIKDWKLKVDFEILISTCIGHEQVNDYCLNKNYNIKCIKEEKPLGTFGAIANVASQDYSKNYLVLNGDTVFKADFNMIYNSFENQEENLPLIILKETTTNERYGGYENTNAGWIFSNKKTSYISMGAFFISHKSIKERWIKKTSINLDTIAINKQTLGELMIDKDCFGEDPIQAFTLKSTIPFLDIGIPSSYNSSQTYIPTLISEMKM
jgi:D-glycero-alpha-D-manno-heptose 1-phosphate guanylyltransferase